MIKYMDLFTDYVIVGGMPNVVKNYVRKRFVCNFAGVNRDDYSHLTFYVIELLLL